MLSVYSRAYSVGMHFDNALIAKLLIDPTKFFLDLPPDLVTSRSGIAVAQRCTPHKSPRCIPHPLPQQLFLSLIRVELRCITQKRSECRPGSMNLFHHQDATKSRRCCVPPSSVSFASSPPRSSTIWLLSIMHQSALVLYPMVSMAMLSICRAISSMATNARTETSVIHLPTCRRKLLSEIRGTSIHVGYPHAFNGGP